MAIRKIRTQGDSILEKECRKIEKMTPKIQELIDDILSQDDILINVIKEYGG